MKGKINLNLDKKGVDGALSFVINTSNAFAAEDNMIASAQLLINHDPNLPTQPVAAQAGFNGSVVFLDMTEAFGRFGATTDLATKYTYSIKDEGGEVTNIKTMFKNWVDGLTYSEPQGGSGSGDTTTPPAEEGAGIGIWGTIYNLLNGGTGGTSTTTADDVIKLVDSKIGKYLKFDLVGDNGDALGFEEILAKITAIYATAADDLTGAVSAEGTEAGAQLFSTEGANLLTFVSKFIKIPAIVEKEDGTGYKFDWNAEAVEINDAGTLEKYVVLAFGLYPADGQYASYINPELIRRIVGVGYKDIIKNIYVYAGYNAGKGLDGYIGIRENKEATESYIRLGASIGFGMTGNYAEIPDDLTGYTDFTAKTEGAAETAKDYYQIFGTTWALLDAFLAYNYQAA